MITCAKCHAFVSKPKLITNGLDEIVEASGTCWRHGKVSINWDDGDWEGW